MTLETVEDIGTLLGKNHKFPIQLNKPGYEGRVLISPHLLGRVIALSALGSTGRSNLFTRAEAMVSPDLTKVFDPQGGDRTWPCPEGAKEWSLYFPPGTTEFNQDNWRVPHYFDKVPFNVDHWQGPSASLSTSMNFTNVKGSSFETFVNLQYALLDSPVELSEQVAYVGYSKTVTYTNEGTKSWNSHRGYITPWSLSMQRAPLNSTEGAWMILPVKDGKTGEILDHRIPGSGDDAELPDRFLTRDNYALFRADGKYRRKKGLKPEIATGYVAAIDLDQGLLTIMQVPVTDERYIDNRWKPEGRFGGTCIDIYNDGGAIAGQGADSMYELEGVCHVKNIAPGQSIGMTINTHQFQLKNGANRVLLYNILNQMTNVDLTEETFRRVA